MPYATSLLATVCAHPIRRGRLPVRVGLYPQRRPATGRLYPNRREPPGPLNWQFSELAKTGTKTIAILFVGAMATKHHKSVPLVQDLRTAPAYGFAEAARYLRLPLPTLRHWSLGLGKVSPVFSMDDPDRQYLSFMNLVEAHILAGIRRKHGVGLQQVRRAPPSAGPCAHVHHDSPEAPGGIGDRVSAIAIARLCGKERNFSGEHFWARGYAVSTVGFELEQVRQYIREQDAADGSAGQF